MEPRPSAWWNRDMESRPRVRPGPTPLPRPSWQRSSYFLPRQQTPDCSALEIVRHGGVGPAIQLPRPDPSINGFRRVWQGQFRSSVPAAAQ